MQPIKGTFEDGLVLLYLRNAHVRGNVGQEIIDFARIGRGNSGVDARWRRGWERRLCYMRGCC